MSKNYFRYLADSDKKYIGTKVIVDIGEQGHCSGIVTCVIREDDKLWGFLVDRGRGHGEPLELPMSCCSFVEEDKEQPDSPKPLRGHPGTGCIVEAKAKVAKAEAEVAKRYAFEKGLSYLSRDDEGPNAFEYPAKGYEKLYKILMRAHNQAAYGKGKDCHATGQPFDKQPIMGIQRMLGSADGPRFQAIKKIQESVRLKSTDAVVELLGAMNYLAAAIIYIEEEAE